MLNNEVIANNIRRIMKDRGLSIYKLADLMNASYSTIYSHIGDKSDSRFVDIRLSFLIQYAEVLDCTINDLLENSYERDPNKKFNSYIFTIYPYNLALDYVVFKKTGNLDKKDLSNDEMETLIQSVYIPFLLECVENELTVREKLVLERRYQYHETYDDIGKTYRVTRERVRQILYKAFSKLVDVNATNKIEVVRKTDLLKSNVKRDIGERAEQPIEALGLSVRERNCLKRAGIKTVGDLLEYSTGDDLLKIRNLGIKSMSSIKDKLLKFAFK